MKIQILVDNPESWIVPYSHEICQILVRLGHDATLLNDPNDIIRGDILCLLSCENKFDKLSLNSYNLVVHESALPNGKGWSPLTWQVLEGKSEIPVTLFEASDKIDAGDIYSQKYIYLNGNELLDEIKHMQGSITIELIIDFVKSHPENICYPQIGKSTFYKKRTHKDSMLDINKSIKEQFNLLRVCDNDRYPAFFEYNGIEYTLRITKK